MCKICHFSTTALSEAIEFLKRKSLRAEELFSLTFFAPEILVQCPFHDKMGDLTRGAIRALDNTLRVRASEHSLVLLTEVGCAVR